jgi:SAM-dependent methyltransferase
MTATIDPQVARAWIDRWDIQQERYVADREERFQVIGDVVAAVLAGRPSSADRIVLDLGCGPGSLAGRLADRLPGVRLLGLDADPLMLALAGARYGAALELMEADFNKGLPDGVPAQVDAAVSTTALHWLDAAPLAALYRELAARIRPGGVLVNGDHLPADDTELRTLTRVVGDARAERVGVMENEEWAQWWAAAGADTALGPLVEERSQLPIANHGGNSLSAAQHAALLRSAGFRAAASVWQCGEDQVLVAIR